MRMADDQASFECLALEYRREADSCLEKAERQHCARGELVRSALQWIELAREAEARRRPN
jgi:hypothetical protein